MKNESGRALLQAELEILRFILGAEASEAELLRAQLEGLVVVGFCTCGCPTIDLAPAPRTVPATEFEGRLFPAEAVVTPLNEEPPGEIIVFVDGGHLSRLEYVYYTDTPPAAWPELSRLTLR